MAEQTIIEPVPLELTDGRNVRIMVTAGAALRLSQKRGIDVMKEKLDPRAMEPRVLYQCLADSLIKWDPNRKPRPGFVYDNQLEAEADTCECGAVESEHPTTSCNVFMPQLMNTIELSSAVLAWFVATNRANKGLPHMPLPGTETATADHSPSTSLAASATPTPNG